MFQLLQSRPTTGVTQKPSKQPALYKLIFTGENLGGGGDGKTSILSSIFQKDLLCKIIKVEIVEKVLFIKAMPFG